MGERVRYDGVVIGGGPAGIFAAYTLAKAGRRTLLLEAGRPMVESLCPKIKVGLGGRIVRGGTRFAMQCKRCTCLTGLGGAAFHFDTNLGYPMALSRSKIERGSDGEVKAFSSLERTLSPIERAEAAVRAVFDILDEHGLKPDEAAESEPSPSTAILAEFDGQDLTASQSITVNAALSVVENMIRAFKAAGGEMRFETRAFSIDRGIASRFVVTTETAGASLARIESNAVVVAVGKLGLSWVRGLVDSLNLSARPADRIDIGVRLEGRREQMAALSERCANPKLAYINPRGESVRTFCVCNGGRIMQYEFNGAVVLDGQHCLTAPTRHTNLGIVTTMNVPAGRDGTDVALDLARRVTERGGHRPVACTVGELISSRIGTPKPPSLLDTSLIDFEHAPLTECLPIPLVDDVLGMVQRLNAAFPGLVRETAVVAAPVVERVYPQLLLSGTMESSQPGLYFVGDASSKIIGVTYGAATGLVAARAIVTDDHSARRQDARS